MLVTGSDRCARDKVGTTTTKWSDSAGESEEGSEGRRKKVSRNDVERTTGGKGRVLRKKGSRYDVERMLRGRRWVV